MKAVAAVVYLASKDIPAFDKYKSCKLLFLADKFHLVRYGRPITGDEYWAMEHGPAPSNVLNILNLVEKQDIKTDPARAFSEALELDRTFAHPRLRGRRAPDIDVLSQSDIAALDRIVDMFGAKTFAELKALTHEMVAYQKAWSRKSPKKRAAPMAFEDFFEEDSDAVAGILEEVLENDALRKTFSGR